MNESMKEIIDEFLKNFKYNATYENEHFLYWIKGEYFYDDYPVTREEFDLIKRHASYNGTLPCFSREERLLDKTLKEDERAYHTKRINEKNSTYSREVFLRYSKTYQQLELYNFDINVRANTKLKSGRVYSMASKKQVFSITSKGYVKFGRKRWLSLKNWYMFSHSNHLMGVDFSKLLLKSMIGKDWVLNLDEKSLKISNKNSRKANSLDEAVEIECGAKPAKFIKKIFNNDINSIISFYKIIDPNQIHHITNFVQRNKDNFERMFSYYDNYMHEKSYFVLILYFLCRDNRCEVSTLKDYFKMLSDSGQKINLNISSYSTIKSRHDEISRKILLKTNKKRGASLGVKKIYPDIKSFPGLEIEKIKTTGRLNGESEMLHHCVHSYKEQIKSGTCAIYSLLYEGKRYTLQVNATAKDNTVEVEKREYNFQLHQLKGVHNSNPPESIKPLLEKMCSDNNFMPLSSSYIYFQKNEKLPENKKEIVQIGEKILDSVDGYGNIKRLYKDEKQETKFINDETLVRVEAGDFEF